MKAPRFFATALVFAVALSLVAGLAQAGPQKTPPKKPEAKPQEKIFMDNNRQGRKTQNDE